MKAGKRHIENGDEYNHLFPKSNGGNLTIKKHAFLNDTIELMQRVFDETVEDTAKIAPLLKGQTEYETCQNVWAFTYNHLQYTLDEKGKEQVRRPARAWHDRKQGVDCDCMSVFIGSILLNLNIPFSLRLTKNNSKEFEHVYPVAHTNNGILILDAVIDQFNQEAPHTYKKDIKIMELQYLNGATDNPSFSYKTGNPPSSYNHNGGFVELDSSNEFEDIDDFIDNDYPMDAQALLTEDQDLEGFRDFFKKAKKKVSNVAQKVQTATQKITPKKIKATLKKGLHAINRVNPVTALLRVGVLASMKLNVMQVASKLRFAYWSDQQARINQIHASKFHALKRIREKLEKIFYGAGGKPDNLRKAILESKGNRDRRVTLNGLGTVIMPVHDEDDLKIILGDLYHDEMADIETGINGLGVVATGTAIAAASGAIATIAALIKKLGMLFPKGSANAEQDVMQENTEIAEERKRKFSFKNLAETVKKVGQNFQNLPLYANKSTPSSTTPNQSNFVDMDNDFPPFDDNPTINTRQKPIKPDNDVDTKDESDKDDKKDPKEGKGDNAFVAWIKENPTPSILIGVGTVGITSFLIYKGIQAKKTKAEEVKKLNSYKKKSTSQEVSGVSKKEKPSQKAKKKSFQKARPKSTAKKANRKTTARKPKRRTTIKKVTLL